MDERGYEEVDHTAEWSLRVWAPDMVGLLTQAAVGMFALVEVEPRSGASQRWRTLTLQAPDHEGLLVHWLHELLFGLETRQMTTTEFDIEVAQEPRLSGRIREAPASRPKKHIKAVTYHELDIQERDGRLETLIVFDV